MQLGACCVEEHCALATGYRLEDGGPLLAALVLLLISSAAAAPLTSLGGLDLTSACRRQKAVPSARAVLDVPSDPYAWRCEAAGTDLGGLDLTTACRHQHGREDATARVLDPERGDSWDCEAPRPAAAPPHTGLLAYTSWGKTHEQLHPVYGERVVLLLDSLRPVEETEPVLALLDACAAHYRAFSGGRWPTVPLPGHPEHASLAIVTATCGAGCGAGGRAELTQAEHQDAVRRMGSFTAPLTWNVGLYELGRGGSSPEHPAFPFYSALDPSPDHGVVASSFPEFMAAMCTEQAGVPIASQITSHAERGYPRVPGPQAYGELFQAADVSFEAALSAKQGKLERNWALAALLYDLHRQHGTPFMQRFFKALAAQPQAKSQHDVVTNLSAAIESAGGASAREQAVKRWRLDG